MYILVISGIRVSHLEYHSFPTVASLAATMLLIASDSMLYFCVLVYVRTLTFRVVPEFIEKVREGSNKKKQERGAHSPRCLRSKFVCGRCDALASLATGA